MKIIGIDLGEYGFGWAVFNCSTETFEEKGFCEIPALKSLFSSDRMNAKNQELRGTWSRSTRKIQIKMNHAIGAVENQIDALLMKFGAASAILEGTGHTELEGHVAKSFQKILLRKYVPEKNHISQNEIFKNKWGAYAGQLAKHGRNSVDLMNQCENIAERFMNDWEKKFL